MSTQVSVSLSEENLAWLDANYNNRSGYINDLLDEAREGNGEIDTAIKQYQIEQLKADIAGAESRIETKRSRLESLQAEVESEKEQQERQLEKAKESLDGTKLHPDNPAIEKWAGKVNLTPTELIEELE